MKIEYVLIDNSTNPTSFADKWQSIYVIKMIEALAIAQGIAQPLRHIKKGDLK